MLSVIDSSHQIYVGIAIEQKQGSLDKLQLASVLGEYLASDELSRIILVTSAYGNWASELRSQLVQLRNNTGHCYLCLFLDDFYLTRPINPEHLRIVDGFARSHKTRYLSLVKQRRTIWGDIYAFITAPSLKNPVVIRYTDAHYPHALQVALWDIDYLIDALLNESNPWDFEKRVASADHFAVKFTICQYIHIIEKGKLRRRLKQYLPHCDLVRSFGHEIEKWDRSALASLKCMKFKLIGYYGSK